MKTTKPRNREHRTKPVATEGSVIIKMRVPRESYDRMRNLVQSKRATKEDIFLLVFIKIGWTILVNSLKDNRVYFSII